MNIWFNDNAAQAAASVGAASQAGRCMFVLTPSREQCGVESFTRLLARALQIAYPQDGYAVLPVSGRWLDLPRAAAKMLRADRVVFSVPLVAWKRMLLIPLALLLVASIARCDVCVFVHEWSALHKLRRLAVAPFLLLSRTIIVVSPFIAEQIDATRWLCGAGKKCRLVPNAPVVHPGSTCITDRVERVRQAARECDLVIGYFGAIYKSKGADALLDVCHHLRSRGTRVLLVFIGSFMKSIDDYERQFWEKVVKLRLESQVLVTGYVADDAELYTLFDAIDAFLFLFPEGLTARRSSVIHCLQSGRPVVVTAPRSMKEFAHHEGFAAVIEAGGLRFVPSGADLSQITERLLDAARQGQRQRAAPIDSKAWWRATTRATHAALLEIEGERAPT